MSATGTDEHRFEVLYRSHYAAIVRFAHRRVDAATAEEVVAETFAIAWRRLADVPSEPLPWLYVVARNLLLADRRATSNARAKHEQAAHLAETGTRDPADALSERDVVMRAFTALSQSDQEALRLTAWDGLDHRAGAIIAGVSRVAFTMRVSRARRRLAAHLEASDQHATAACRQPAPLEQST